MLELLVRRVLPGLASGLACMLAASGARADKQGGPFEIQPMVGYSFINLTGFSEDKFFEAAPDPEDSAAFSDGEVDVQGQIDSMFEASQVPVEGDGPSAGLGLQLNFWVFVLGGRYAYAHTTDFGMHTFGGDLGVRVGESVALYGRGGLGYALLSGLPEGINAQGFYVDLGGGLEVRPGDHVSIGLGVDGDLLLLGSTGQIRTAAEAAMGSVDSSTASEIDGSAVGFQIRPQLHLTWHL